MRTKELSYWITDKYIYLMLLVYPLFIGFWGYTRLTASKFVFFSALTLIWFLLLVADRIKTKPACSARPTLPQALMLLFFLSNCVSAVVSKNFVSSLLGEGRFDGLLTVFLYTVIFMGVSTFGRPKRKYIRAIALSMTVCCGIAVLQFLGYNALWLYPHNYSYYDGGYKFSGEFLGTIGNANLFSAYLCLCLPLFSAYYITEEKVAIKLFLPLFVGTFCSFVCRVSAGKLALFLTALLLTPLLITDGKRLRRGLDILAVILLALCMAETFSAKHSYDFVSISLVFTRRSAFFAAAAVIAAVLRLLLKNTVIAAKTLRRLFSMLSVLISVILFVAIYNWQDSEGTIFELSRIMRGEIRDSFGSSRILIWRNTLSLVKDRLLFGGGPGTLRLILDVNFSRFVEETGKTLSASVDNAHNVYLGILANSGLLSLLFYLSAMISGFIGALRSKRTFALCLACSLMCCWIQDFFGLGLFIVSPLMFIFWGLIGGQRAANH